MWCLGHLAPTIFCSHLWCYDFLNKNYWYICQYVYVCIYACIQICICTYLFVCVCLWGALWYFNICIYCVMFKSGYTYPPPQMLIISNDKIVKIISYILVKSTMHLQPLYLSFLPPPLVQSPGHFLTWMIFDLLTVSPELINPWLTFVSSTVFYIIQI